MMDVKKLTTSFLVLAGVAGLIAFGFSGGGLYPRFGNAPAGRAAATVGVPSNAFVLAAENLPPTLQRNLAGAETNITKATAENLAQVIVGLNPYGPQTIDGQTGLVIPTTTVLVGYLRMENPRFKLADIWVSPSDEAISLAPGADAASNSVYKEGFKNALKATLSSDGYLSIVGKASAAGVSQEFLNISALTWSAAIQRLKTLPTPAPFAEFQKSFLAYLEDQRNALLVAGDLNDPLKSLAVLGHGAEVKQRFASDFGLVMQARRALDPALLSRSDDPVWSALISGLTIPAANAQGLAGTDPQNDCGADNVSQIKSALGDLTNLLTQVPVHDEAVTAASAGILGVLIFDCESRILTQEAKKGALDLLQKQSNENVKNGQDPRVIRNYPAYFGDAGIRAATKARKELSSETCPELQPQIDAAVFSPDNVTGLTNDANTADLNANTITNVSAGTTGGGFGATGVNGTGNGCSIETNTDVNAYYNDFSSDPAAWDDYFSLLTDPSNNFFGTIAASRDEINGRAASAESGAKAQSIAGGGYKPDVNCTHYDTDQNGNQICDQQRIVTPGGTVAADKNAAVTSRYLAVATAQDLAQLDGEVADAYGTQLLQHPDQGVTDLAINTGNSLASVCSNFAPPSYASGLAGANTAQSACNNIVSQIIGQFNKYLSIIQNIGSLLGGFL